jgi:hypothetical protein
VEEKKQALLELLEKRSGDLWVTAFEACLILFLADVVPVWRSGREVTML